MNEQIYQDRRGEWMLSRGIESTFNIPQWQIDRWAKDRCPYLNGRRTVARKEIANPWPGSVGLNGKVHVYLVADVEEIVANQKKGGPVDGADGKHLDGDIFEDGAKEKWISAPGAKRRFNINIESLRRWAKNGCRYLDGRRVRTKRIEGRHLRPSLLFSLVDVEHVYSRMPANSAPSPEHRDDEGAWATNAQIRERFGVSQIFCIYWSSKRSRLRKSGPALRWKLIHNHSTQIGSHSQVRAYRLDDVNAIIDRTESESAYEGRGVISDEQQTRLAKEACRVLKTILANGPVEVGEAARMAEECGVRHGALYRARKELGDKIITRRQKHGPGTWELRGVKAKKPAATPDHVPHLKVTRLTVEHCEAETFRASNMGQETTAWLTVTKAANMSGVDKATISAAATAGRIKSNGKTRHARRIDAIDFSRWLDERAGKLRPPGIAPPSDGKLYWQRNQEG